MSMWMRRPGVDSTYRVSTWLSRFIEAAAEFEAFARTLASDGGASAVKDGRRRIVLIPMWRRRAMTAAAASVVSAATCVFEWAS